LVLAAVKKLRYVPNAHAKRLASRTSRALGMIVSDIENPFFPEVIRSFEERARQRGYEVVLSDTNYDPRLMQRATERMVEQKVRGVAIMTSEMAPRLITEMIRRRIAVTFLDLGPVRKYASNIKIDYFSGIRQVVEHLFSLGHRQIAFVAGRPTLESNVAREMAYVESMHALGLTAGPILHGNLRLEGGYAAGLELLKLLPGPTAVLAVNDLTAVGIINALTRNGVNVPRDISVAGFDKTHLAEYFVPSLTTVDIRRDLLGELAADALHELFTSAKPQGKEYCIPAELVIGESTGPPPASLQASEPTPS
jgi:LacI family transcriptional regulator